MLSPVFKESLVSVFRPVWRPLPAPGPEGLIARACLAALALVVMWGISLPPGVLAAPSGLSALVDLSFVSRPGVFSWMTWAFALLCVPYVFAQGLTLVVPLLTLLYGAVMVRLHALGGGEPGQLMVALILLAQTAVVLFFAAHRQVKGRPFPLRAGRTRDSYLIYYSQVALVGAALGSALVMVTSSSFAWNDPLPSLGPPVVAAQEPVVSPALGMTEHPRLSKWLLGVSLLVKGLCFLALANRGWALLAGASLLVLPLALDRSMEVSSESNPWALLIFLINAPFWVVWSLRRWADRPPTGAGRGR